jgi:nucleoside phosphorylase
VASVDVLIVTALKLERLAARSHLEEVEVDRESGLATDLGRFTSNSCDVSVAVVQTGAGNVGAAVQTSRAEAFFRPALILMTGIAGGVKDVTIGDVVASEKVYWIEGGKDAQEWHPRIDVAPVSDSLRQIARAIAADDAWRTRVQGDSGPRAFVAPIAAGEKVLANRRSDLVQRIRRDASDAVCIDMEDYGTVRAGAATERARTLAIRGISDLLDNKGEVEKEGSQDTAADNAAAFTFELIAHAFADRSPALTQGELTTVLAAVYPQGPQERAIWERAGGDIASLEFQGNGYERWWRALGLIQNGGGPRLLSLLETATEEFPHNAALRAAHKAAIRAA